MPPLAFVLRVKDHVDHDVGTTDSALDVKARVDWAWKAVKSSPVAKKGAVARLSLDVQAGTVNGTTTGTYAKLLRESAKQAGILLPLLAKAWDPAAPDTLTANLAKKIGDFSKVRLLDAGMCECESDESIDTVQAACALPMESLPGTKRAARAQLVAAVFAAELSKREAGAPVLVLGRPPGHHATCAHSLNLLAPPHPSPGGDLEGRCLGGGCFYPSCWLGAVHCLRQGTARRLAYIDLDAHMPDGVWKEVDCLRGLSRERRKELFNGKADACEGVFFASVHVDGYPNPSENGWKSTVCVQPQGPRKAFEVRVHQELLPRGVADGGTTLNKEVLSAFERWKGGTLRDLCKFRPDGVFFGLGFDLHRDEACISDKRAGLGLTARNYRDFLRRLPVSANSVPLVLTLEGGYTKAGVVDGTEGVLAGMVEHSRACRRMHLAKTKCSRAARPRKSLTLSRQRLQTSLKKAKRARGC